MLNTDGQNLKRTAFAAKNYIGLVDWSRRNTRGAVVSRYVPTRSLECQVTARGLPRQWYHFRAVVPFNTDTLHVWQYRLRCNHIICMAFGLNFATTTLAHGAYDCTTVWWNEDGGDVLKKLYMMNSWTW